MKSFGNIAKDGQVRVVASGTLTDGKAVIVNANGTVSVVDPTSGSPAFGSAVVFNAATVAETAATFDSNSNKVVIAYRDYGNSSYGTAIVGTVSGNSISFGSEVVFESGGPVSYLAATFDSNSNKVVIAYKDEANTNKATAIVGTVSGTSISFGSHVIFHSSNFFYTDAVFDSNSNKVVITYAPEPNYYTTTIVGTVSGTSISFGSPVQVYSNNGNQARSTFDSNSNKVVITYEGSSNYPNVVVGTVSGTSISYGTAVVAQSVGSNSFSLTFDSNSNKVVLGYRATTSSNHGTAVVGTVSGTSISFGTPVVFIGGSGTSQDSINLAFDTSTNKVGVVYRDVTTSPYYGQFVLGTVSGTSISFGTATDVSDKPFNSSPYNATVFDSNNNSFVVSFKTSTDNYGYTSVFGAATNLTTENFIGFSDGAFATTQSAVINTANTIDRNQTSLTPGQTYFVLPTGALSTTAGDPSVKAGTAISSTELIVKG